MDLTKVQSVIVGAAIGDALGVPVEFLSREELAASPVRDMRGFGTHNQPAGTWSDDTSMTLCLLESIGRGKYDNGNGSLMRILPLAFTDCTDEEIRAVSAITHGHEISMQACVIYVHVARRLLAGETIQEIIPDLIYDKPFDRLSRIDQLTEDEIRSGGFVVDTLEASLWCLANNRDFRETVLAAVNLGKDTDTTGAVCGGLAGIVYGLDSDFAKECMEQLRGREVIEECL